MEYNQIKLYFTVHKNAPKATCNSKIIFACGELSFTTPLLDLTRLQNPAPPWVAVGTSHGIGAVVGTRVLISEWICRLLAELFNHTTHSWFSSVQTCIHNVSLRGVPLICGVSKYTAGNAAHVEVLEIASEF